ncbi:MAG: hypothetical protein KF797_03075 [Flavobacteriales bacterium]|nr:hypothetical protein [Flavobacteriales bacterium]
MLRLRIAASAAQGRTNYDRGLLDGHGHEVATEQFSGNGSEFVLKAPLDAGLYYLHLRDEQKWLAGQKVVVE